MDEARDADNRRTGSGGDHQFHGRRDKSPAIGPAYALAQIYEFARLGKTRAGDFQQML
jgi:hypothetical protein